MSKYETYKTTGVDWIGDVPENWKVKRIKRIADIYRGASPRPIDDERYFDENGKYSWVRISDVTASDTYLMKTEEKLSELGSSLSVKIKEGDLFLSIAGSVGKPMISKIDACIHDGFLWLKSPKIDTKYFIYLLSADGIYGGLGKMGTQLNLNSQIVGSVIIPIPTSSEQLAIANHLDIQTQKIDKLIANKKVQAKKLKELRQIEINNAVTKGLNPNVELKDSGIDWLGKIPKHWNVKRIKNVCQIVNGSTPSSSIDRYWEGDIIWVTPGDYKNYRKYIDNSENKITEEGYKNCGTSLVPAGSIILSTRAPIGNVLIASKELCTNQGCKSIIPLLNNSEFLYFVFTISSIQLNILGQGTTFLELSTGNLGTYKIPKPPIQEQIQIADYLNKRTTAIDTLIGNVETQIEKLQELRKIKIYEAVTGKIKVNAYAETTA